MSWKLGRQFRRLMCLSVIATTFGPTVQRGHANPPRERALFPGLETSHLDTKLKGLVLLSEFNCVACHAMQSSLVGTSKLSPRLTAVGTRVNPYYLEEFIQTPHQTKPGTTMPNVMLHLEADERRQVAKTITHYLLSLSESRPFDLQAIDTVAAEHGEELFHTVGCVACHSPRDRQGKELLVDSSVPLGALEKKYNTRSLVEFLRAPLQTRPSGRMPDMGLNNRDAERLAHFLLRKTRVPGHLRYTLFRGRVWEGLDVNVTKEKSGLVEDFDLGSFPQLPWNSAIVYEGYVNIDMMGD